MCLVLVKNGYQNEKDKNIMVYSYPHEVCIDLSILRHWDGDRRQQMTTTFASLAGELYAFDYCN